MKTARLMMALRLTRLQLLRQYPHMEWEDKDIVQY